MEDALAKFGTAYGPLLLIVAGFFLKEAWGRVARVERADARQGSSLAALEERLNAQSLRLNGLEAHVNQIADIRADIRQLQTEVKSMSDSMRTMVSIVERAARRPA